MTKELPLGSIDMTEPPYPPRRITGGLLTYNDYQEYREYVKRNERGWIVPLGAACSLTTRIKRDVQFRCLPGRDRFLDQRWLIDRELTSVADLILRFSTVPLQAHRDTIGAQEHQLDKAA